MTAYRTAQEVKQEHLDHMGPELGEIFHALYNELAWLRVKWGEYRELYGTMPSRIDLLNKCAPLFFKLAEDSIWNDTLLHICRITDRPNSMGKENLSIQRLPSLVDDSIRSVMKDLVKEAKEKTEFCRDWRNRKIAHHDLNLAIGGGAKPLEAASRERVEIALDSIGVVLNHIARHYYGSTIVFDGQHRSEGAISLLYLLDDGLTTRRERQDKKRSGESISGQRLRRKL